MRIVVVGGTGPIGSTLVAMTRFDEWLDRAIADPVRRT